MSNTFDKEERKKEIMEKCYECYCENGLREMGIKALAKACDMTSPNLYAYFDNADELIIESTAYCMSKVEDEFMEMAPKSPQNIIRAIDEIPKWTAEKHGAKYRLMYQVYSMPKHREAGQKFFEGVNLRYAKYARILEKNLNIPWQDILGYIFFFVSASVHYAMFEDEEYLKTQMALLKKCW